MLLIFFCFRSNDLQHTDSLVKDESHKLMTLWPDIVRELTENNNQELQDVNEWTAKVSIFFFFNFHIIR